MNIGGPPRYPRRLDIANSFSIPPALAPGVTLRSSLSPESTRSALCSRWQTLTPDSFYATLSSGNLIPLPHFRSSSRGIASANDSPLPPQPRIWILRGPLEMSKRAREEQRDDEEEQGDDKEETKRIRAITHNNSNIRNQRVSRKGPGERNSNDDEERTTMSEEKTTAMRRRQQQEEEEMMTKKATRRRRTRSHVKSTTAMTTTVCHTKFNPRYLCLLETCVHVARNTEEVIEYLGLEGSRPAYGEPISAQVQTYRDRGRPPPFRKHRNFEVRTRERRITSEAQQGCRDGKHRQINLGIPHPSAKTSGRGFISPMKNERILLISWVIRLIANTTGPLETRRRAKEERGDEEEMRLRKHDNEDLRAKESPTIFDA
ncbi:hypothetical protein EV360DRAFT_76638 [Lentinula raphanica]|nr:hypothetical protein EV360DRAFT_76638 [Lentinula raphanica]